MWADDRTGRSGRKEDTVKRTHPHHLDSRNRPWRSSRSPRRRLSRTAAGTGGGAVVPAMQPRIPRHQALMTRGEALNKHYGNAVTRSHAAAVQVAVRTPADVGRTRWSGRRGTPERGTAPAYGSAATQRRGAGASARSRPADSFDWNATIGANASRRCSWRHGGCGRHPAQAQPQLLSTTTRSGRDERATRPARRSCRSVGSLRCRSRSASG